DLPNISQRIQENRDQGMNQLAAVLNAPGVRMAPGAFVAGQLAQGTAGARELATHPLMAFLDVLPVANKAAAGTQVGRLATQAAEQAGRRPRALTALVTGKVLRDADGNLVPAASIAQHQGVVPSQQGGLA